MGSRRRHKRWTRKTGSERAWNGGLHAGRTLNDLWSARWDDAIAEIEGVGQGGEQGGVRVEPAHVESRLRPAVDFESQHVGAIGGRSMGRPDAGTQPIAVVEIPRDGLAVTLPALGAIGVTRGQR